MTHEELNKIFNEKKYFISYDTYTYYSIYAAICGCTSIVVPDIGISKEEWHPKVEETYGISYGLDDLKYAENTKHLMIKYIENQQKENINSVKNFIKLCEDYFK